MQFTFPALSGSIGMITSQTDCTSFSSTFTAAACTSNGLDELYLDFTVTSSGTQTGSFSISAFRNSFQTGTSGPVHVTIYETIDSVNYGLSNTDQTAVLEAELVYVGAISTPYTLTASVSLEGGGVVNTQDTLQIEWDFPDQYVVGDCYLKVQMPGDFSMFAASDISVKGKGCMAASTSTMASYNSINSASISVTASTLTILYEGACPETLGTLDCGIQIIGAYNPIVVKDTDTFSLDIYTDSTLTYQVATSSSIFLDSSELSPATIVLNSFTSDITEVSEGDATYTIVFVPSIAFDMATIIEINMPDRLLDLDNCVAQSDELNGNSDSCSRDSIRFESAFFTDTEAGMTFTLLVGTGTNGESVRDQGTLIISALFLVDGIEYTVAEFSGDSGYIPTVGSITSATITPSSYVTYFENVEYTFNVISKHGISTGSGFIEVTFPTNDLIIKDSSVSYICSFEGDSPRTCSINLGTATVMLGLANDQTMVQGSLTQFSFSGLYNPRSLEPFTGIGITTYDVDGYLIDQTLEITSVTMTTMAEIDGYVIEYVDPTTGTLTELLFSFKSVIPIKTDDRFYAQIPEQVTLPEGDDLICTAVQNIETIRCKIDDDILIVFFEEIDQDYETGDFKFTLDNIQTYYSTFPSDAFGSIYWTNGNNFGIEQISDTIILTNEYPALITTYLLTQESYDDEVINTYTFTFTPTNKIPDTGVVTLTWPSTVRMLSDSDCEITARRTYTENCSVNVKSRTITIENLFQDVSTFYTGEVTIVKSDFENVLFRELEWSAAFEIRTYTDVTLEYEIDALPDGYLYPQLQCGFACASCDRAVDPAFCLSCFPSFKFDHLQEGRCQMGCDEGFSKNGNAELVCEQCDESCLGGCFDQGEEDDVKRCFSCREDYVYTYKGDHRCFLDEGCGYGFFHLQKLKCGKCERPCGDCVGDPFTCTECDAGQFLQGSTCLPVCFDGWGPLNGTNVCEQCDSDCRSCLGTADFCDSCLGVGGREWTYGGDCYEVCPLGTARDKAVGGCEACGDSSCDICSLEEKDTCLLCHSPLLVYNATCVETCPANTFVSFDETDCVETLWNLPLIYFPHFCTIFVVAVALAIIKCFKKDTLYFTSFIGILGSIEAISYFVQMIIAFIFQSYIYAFIAALSWLFTLCINIAFYVWFTRRLDDPSFSIWEDKHPKSTKRINLGFLVLSFKLVRVHFCRFFNLPCFYASFLYPGQLHKPLVWATVANAVFSYVPIVASDIVGLLTMRWGNQLYINMIETLIISLIMIILQIYELFTLRKTIGDQYNSLNAETMQTATMGLDETTKQNMIRSIVNKVQEPRGIFKIKDIQQLKDRFNPRDCDSVHLPIKEVWGEDERECLSNRSWITFGEADSREDKHSYRETGNASTLMPTLNPFTSLGKDFDEIWGETDPGDFQDAQKRKKHPLLSKEDDEDEKRMKLKQSEKMKRGRVNRYIKQIHLEDNDQSIDGLEETKPKQQELPEYDFGGALQPLSPEQIQEMEEHDHKNAKKMFRTMSRDQQILDQYATDEKARLQRNKSSVHMGPRSKASPDRSLHQVSPSLKTDSPSKAASRKSGGRSVGKSMRSKSPQKQFQSPSPLNQSLNNKGRHNFEDDLMLSDLNEIERQMHEEDTKHMSALPRRSPLDPRNQDLYDFQDDELSQHEHSHLAQTRKSHYLMEQPSNQHFDQSPNNIDNERFESEFEQTKEAHKLNFDDKLALKQSKKAQKGASKENAALMIKSFAEGSLSNKKKVTANSAMKASTSQRVARESRRNSDYQRPSLKDGSNRKLKTFIRSTTKPDTRSLSHHRKAELQQSFKKQPKELVFKKEVGVKSVTPTNLKRGQNEFKSTARAVMEGKVSVQSRLDEQFRASMSASQTPQTVKVMRLKKNQKLIDDGARFVSLKKSK